MGSSVKNFAISPSVYISLGVFCQVTKVYAYGNIQRNGKACLVEFVLYLKNIDDKSNHLQYLNGNLSYCNFYTRVWCTHGFKWNRIPSEFKKIKSTVEIWFKYYNYSNFLRGHLFVIVKSNFNSLDLLISRLQFIRIRRLFGSVSSFNRCNFNMLGNIWQKDLASKLLYSIRAISCPYDLDRVSFLIQLSSCLRKKFHDFEAFMSHSRKYVNFIIQFTILTKNN